MLYLYEKFDLEATGILSVAGLFLSLWGSFLYHKLTDLKGGSKHTLVSNLVTNKLDIQIMDKKMARQIQIRRGTAEEHKNFTGAIGEITMDTTNKTLRVHDGETTGGTPLAKQSDLDNADYVIEYQTPTAENNYTWYRKYKRGWVEQGGKSITNSDTPKQIILPIEMEDTYYEIFIQGTTSMDGYSNAQWQVMPVSTTKSPKTTTSFFAQASIAGYNLSFYWYVRGIKK